MIQMPDQPRGSKIGSGSWGVAVICAARDIINGLGTSYTWSYSDMPCIRAQLMENILSIMGPEKLQISN